MESLSFFAVEVRILRISILYILITFSNYIDIPFFNIFALNIFISISFKAKNK